MDALRLFRVVPEDDEGAVGIEAEAVAREGVVDFLPDHVVRKEDRSPRLALVKRVEHVLTVRRADAPQKLHALDGALEGFRVTALQVVTAGKMSP